MRSLPTRRELVFGVAFLISFVLFLQFAFGPTPADVDSDAGPDWSQKVTVPWLGGSGALPEDARGGRTQNRKLEHQISLLEGSANARDSALVWGSGRVPTTEIRLHAPGKCRSDALVRFITDDIQGWTMYDRLYLMNGTVFIVTDEPQKVPDRMLLISSGYPIKNEPGDVERRIPTDKDLQVISPEKAAELFGSYASRLDGTTVSEACDIL